MTDESESDLRYVDTATGDVHRRNKVKSFDRAMLEGQGEREAYLSWFLCGPELAEHVKNTGSVRGFGEGERAIHDARWLWIDVDRRDEKTGEPDLTAALDATRSLIRALEENYETDPRNLLVYFSGSKGFHLMIPSVLFQGRPHPLLNKAFRKMAIAIAGKAQVDEKIYDLTRLMRIPNSQHGKSNLYKISLKPAEVLTLTARSIADLAIGPRAIENPDDFHLRPEPGDERPLLVELFDKCLGEAEEEEEREAIRRQELATGAIGPVGVGGRLDIDSLDAIEDVIGPHWTKGKRHNLCLAICGYMATHGIPRDECGRFIEYITQRRKDEEAGLRIAEVKTTYDKVEQGKAAEVMGYKGLIEFLSGPERSILERAVKKHAAPSMIRSGVNQPAAAAGDPAGPALVPTIVDPDEWEFLPYWSIRKLTPPPTIVKDLVAGAARIIVSGEPKGAMKTWFCLQLSMSVAAGIPFMGHYEVQQPGPVVYYSGEEPDFMMQERIYKLHCALGINHQIPLFFRDPDRKLKVRFDLGGHLDRFRRMIQKHKPVMCVFEPLANLHQLDENKATDLVAQVLEPLSSIVLDTGITLIVAHHVSKDVLRSGGSRMRGSSALWGWYDSGMHAAKKGKEGDEYVRMEFEHRRIRDQPDLCYQINDGICTDNVTPWARLDRVERSRESESPERRGRRGKRNEDGGGASSAPAGGGIVTPAQAAADEQERARHMRMLGSAVKERTDRGAGGMSLQGLEHTLPDVPKKHIHRYLQHLVLCKLIEPSMADGSKYTITLNGEMWLAGRASIVDPGKPVDPKDIAGAFEGPKAATRPMFEASPVNGGGR